MARCPNKNTAEYKALQDVFQTEVRTNSVINTWQDINNSDAFPTPFQANEMMSDQKVAFALKQKSFALSLLDNLRREHIGHTFQGQFLINNSNPVTREYDSMFLDANVKKLYRYLRINNIPADTVTLQRTPKTYRLIVNEDLFTNKDVLEKSRSWDTNRSREVVMHLKRMFPQVNVEMLSVTEAADMFSMFPEWKKSNVKFKDVKSFYVDGTAYLIKGRVTDETAIEEMLHPLVDAIKVDNPELFNGLLAEASKTFPEMVQQIKAEYNENTRNFSDTERNLEIVTQALSRHFKKEYETNPSQGFLDKVNEFMDWFMELINNLSEYLTGTPLSVKDINPSGNLSDIAKLLNTERIQFKLESRADGKIRFSLSPEKKRQVDQALSEANGVQAEIIKSLFHVANSSDVEVNSLSGSRFKTEEEMQRGDSGETIVVLNEKNHTYYDITDKLQQKPYTSVTTAIKGTLKNLEDVQLNLDIGNDVDALLDALVTHRSVEDVFDQMKIVDLETAKTVYNTLQTTLTNIMPEGSIALSQVVVFDKATKMAGTADLVIVDKNGFIKIVDLKTTKNSLKTYTTEDTKVGRKQTVYYDKEWALSEDSLLKQIGVDKLSTRGQHNLQVNIYRRMFQNMGYDVYMGDYAASTFHLVADITGKGKNQKFNGNIKSDQWVDHPISQNINYVNMLMELNPDTTKKEQLDELTKDMEDKLVDPDVVPADLVEESERLADTVTPVPEDPVYDVISGILKDYQLSLINKIDLLEAKKLAKASIFIDRTKDEAIEQLASTIAFINIAMSEGPIARSSAYSELLQDSLRQVRKFSSYVQDPKNFAKSEYITYVLNFDKFVKTFQGLQSIEDLAPLNATQRSLILSLKTELNKLTGADGTQQGLIDAAINDYVKEIIRNKSNRAYGEEGSYFTEADLELLLKEARDISGADLYTRDLATQGDVILALMDKIYKSKKQELLDKVAEREGVIKAAGNQVIKLTPNAKRNSAYNYMLVYDENGEFTGNYVKKIGQQYYKKQEELRAPLYDNDNNPYQYEEILASDMEELKKTKEGRAKIKYNQDLADAKAAFSAFFRAERTTDGQYDDGEYHTYTKEFKDARDRVEYYVPGKDGSPFGNWYRKPRVSDVQYAKYEARYFKVNEYTKAIRIDGVPTGAIVAGQTYRSPKVKYRVALERSNPVDGLPQDMTSEQYRNIMNPSDALGIAQKEFYELFVQYFENELLEKLPQNVKNNMLGRVPLVQGAAINTMKKKSSFWNQLYAKTVRSRTWNMFNSTSTQKGVMVDPVTGYIVDQMPIFYTGRPKIDGEMEQVEKEKRALQDQYKTGKKQDGTTYTEDDYNTDIASINGKLARLRSTPSVGEISTDLATSLIKFSAMAENFETMATIDDTLNAMMSVIENRSYQPSEGSGVTFIDKIKGVVSGTPKSKYAKNENTKKRAQKWMSQVYYDNENITKGAGDKIAEGIIQLSSLSYVAFNPFGNFNNYLIGRVNNNIELLAGRFVSREAQLRATREFNKRALPDMVSRTGAAMTDAVDVITFGKIPGLKSSEYDPKRANSKYEAFVDMFRMMDKMSELREQGADTAEGKTWFERAAEWGYVMQDAAEYNVQTKMGMAVLMDTTMLNPDSGETLSLYDAFMYDAKSHTNKIKEGFTKIVKVDKNNKIVPGSEQDYTDEFRYDLRNKIREINKQIHGNYAREDRMVMQQHTLGKLAVQFKKWVAPAIRARYQREYFDENLGWMEGRYRSALSFLRYTGQQLRNGNTEFSTYGKGFMQAQKGFDGTGGNADQRAQNKLFGFYRTMGEIAIMTSALLINSILSELLAGDGDDTDLERRMKNLSKYQVNRIYKEMVLFMPWIPDGGKQVFQQFGNPVAATRTFGELSELLGMTLVTGYKGLRLKAGGKEEDYFYGDSSIVYQKGKRRGELKIYKNFKDVFPIVYSIQMWESYLTNDDFYIK